MSDEPNEPSHDAGQPPRRANVRVAFLITQFQTGGAQRALVDRVLWLAQTMDCTVVVLSEQRGYLFDRLVAAGVGVHVVPLEARRSPLARLAALRGVLEQMQPDVVCASLVWDHTYGAVAAALARVPVLIADVQNVRAHIGTYPIGLRIMNALTFLFAFDRLVACSQAAAASFAGVSSGTARRWVTISNGVDVRRIQEGARKPGRSGSVVIGTLGRQTAAKNQALLIRAFAAVAAQHPHVRLRIVGSEGECTTQLRALRRELAIEHLVSIENEVTEPAVFLGEIDVFALPSDWEGLPLALMEAMAAGRPVVATAVGGVPELIDHGNTGWLCPPGEIEPFAAALAALVSDEHRRTAMGRAASDEASRRFDATQAARAWQRLILELHQPNQCPTATCSQSLGRAPILVIATCPVRRLHSIVADVRRRWPNAAIEVVCSSQARAAIVDALPGVWCHTFGRGFLSLSSLGIACTWRLRRRGYQRLVLPYNNCNGDSYFPVEVVARLIAASNVEGYAAWTDDVSPLGLVAVPRGIALPIAAFAAVARRWWKRGSSRSEGTKGTGSQRRNEAIEGRTGQAQVDPG